MSAPVEKLWDASVAIYTTYDMSPELPSWLGRDYHVGVIVRPHKFFLVNDFVIAVPTNGQGERITVYALSGKGRSVVRYYMKFAAHRPWLDSRQYPSGHLRLVSVPDELANCLPTDPGLRQFVVAAARSGSRSQVNANILHTLDDGRAE